MPPPLISCLTVTFGRVRWLQNALHGLLVQDCPVEYEIVIVNTFPRQRLQFEHPRVKILNLDKRPASLGEARNIGVAAASGVFIRVADDDDYALKGDLRLYADAYAANPGCDWILVDGQFYALNDVIKGVTPGACHQFSYSKLAWQIVGGYPPLSCGEDRVLVSNITAGFKGKRIAPVTPQEVYIWGQGVYHASGQGNDKPGQLPVHARIADDLEARVRQGKEPVGEIVLKPAPLADYEEIAAAFMRSKIGVEVGDQRPRIFHAVERHGESDARKLRAQLSWDNLYAQGVVPCHLWKYPRSAREMGDKRPLPFLKDVLQFAMDQAGDGDIIMWTNDDDWLHPELPALLESHVLKHGPCTSKRCEVKAPVTGAVLPPQGYCKGASRHMGRDLFAATKRWLTVHWLDLPDFLLGASDFDLALACMVRAGNGVKSTHANLWDVRYPSEIPDGYVVHEAHSPAWASSENIVAAPSQRHNRALFVAWAKIFLPTAQFSPIGELKF